MQGNDGIHGFSGQLVSQRSLGVSLDFLSFWRKNDDDSEDTGILAVSQVVIAIVAIAPAVAMAGAVVLVLDTGCGQENRLAEAVFAVVVVVVTIVAAVVVTVALLTVLVCLNTGSNGVLASCCSSSSSSSMH